MLWGMRLVARLLAPRQCVGAVGAVFNDNGQVLLVEHTFRTDFPWGLPGGWVRPAENPMDTVKREAEEELKIRIEVKNLIISEQVDLISTSTHPPHLGLAYYCHFISGECIISFEILSYEWVNPQHINREIAPFQLKAITLGKEIFDRERLKALG